MIWSYAFDETSGGIIALHLLCQRLNASGHRALIWQSGRPAFRDGWSMRDGAQWLRYWLGRARRALHKDPFGNPLARRRDLKGAVVVYPEIVAGNPLGGERVVRWLLHRPGHHKGTVDYGANDLFFFYQEAFNDPSLNPDADNRLTLTWFIDAYAQRNVGERTGSAYLMRKGKGRPIVHDLTGSICVDDMSHEERAAVFNRVEVLYCYDLYTMYGLYAAMCGCIPIVIPDPALTKEQWTPKESDRLGIAYGMDDVPWALETRERMLAGLQAVRGEQDRMLDDFVRKCGQHWEKAATRATRRNGLDKARSAE